MKAKECNTWATLDFESSGLSKWSYPIEVGYALSKGHSDSVLINPMSAADGWLYWDEVAEVNRHSLSRRRLHQDGLSVLSVCQHLNHTLCGVDMVFCDSQWDLFWLGRLYRAAYMRPSFTLIEIGHWLSQHQRGDSQLFQRMFSQRGRYQYRAKPDAEQIRHTLQYFLE